MFDTLSDTSLGLLLLAVFMPVVFGAGYVLYRFRNARLDLAWRPLLPLFTEVRTAGDGGGGAASFLRGRYRDRTFEATMWPAVSVYGSIALDSGGQPRFNLFELRLLDVQGSGAGSGSGGGVHDCLRSRRKATNSSVPQPSAMPSAMSHAFGIPSILTMEMFVNPIAASVAPT